MAICESAWSLNCSPSGDFAECTRISSTTSRLMIGIDASAGFLTGVLRAALPADRLERGFAGFAFRFGFVVLRLIARAIVPSFLVISHLPSLRCAVSCVENG